MNRRTKAARSIVRDEIVRSSPKPHIAPVLRRIRQVLNGKLDRLLQERLAAA